MTDLYKAMMGREPDEAGLKAWKKYLDAGMTPRVLCAGFVGSPEFGALAVMLLFLLPDGTAASVKRVFDYLERGLGLECFKRLFPVFLTDNGSEFMKVDELELTEDYEYRTKVFFCDPMASWQKAHIEKNHEYIRYVTPKGKTLTPYTQEDMTLLMNHINSTRRNSLGGKSPYELVDENDEDMHALFSLLKMDLIPPDEVHLKPDLFTKNR